MMKTLLSKIIMLFKNKRLGFTLLESMTVLFITAGILVILLFGVSLFNRQQNNEKEFWQAFDKTWNCTLTLVKTKHTAANVAFYPNDEVVFKSYNHGNNYKKVIKMPRKMSVVKYYEVCINENSYVKPQTIVWKSQNQNERILQKFQLGWGTYRNEIEKI